MVEEAIVAFIDILGYKKIVEKHQDNIKLIQRVEICIKSTLKDISDIYKNGSTGNQNIDKVLNKTVDSIKVAWVSDTFIVTLQPLRNNSDKEWEMSLLIYFRYISVLCQTIIYHTGHVLRGGIAKGRHYANMTDGSLFIFSKAYLDAYELEKGEKKNGKARIVIHDDLKKYLEKFIKKDSRFFFEDTGDRKSCLHFYSTLKKDRESCKKLLRGIKTKVSKNIKQNQYAEEQHKLTYFKDYHNKTVREIFDNQSSELIIS